MLVCDRAVFSRLLFDTKRQFKPRLAPGHAFVGLAQALDGVFRAPEAPCYLLITYEISPPYESCSGRVRVRLLGDKGHCRR